MGKLQDRKTRESPARHRSTRELQLLLQVFTFFSLHVGRTGGTAGRIRATFLLLSLNHSLPERGGFQILPFCWHPKLLLHSWTDVQTQKEPFLLHQCEGKPTWDQTWGSSPNSSLNLHYCVQDILSFNLKNKESRYFLIVSCWTRGEREPKPQTAIFYHIS